MNIKREARTLKTPMIRLPVKNHSLDADSGQSAGNWTHFRWNFRLGIINGVFFSIHDVLINPSLVFVAFLAHLTDNPIILGTTAPLWIGGLMIPQFLISSRMQGMRHSMPIYRIMSLTRALLWLALILVTLLSNDATVLIVALLSFVTLYPLAWGVAAIAFQDIVGKTIPPRRRGTFFSWRMTLGGILGIGGGIYVDKMLDPESNLAFADNFAMIFAGGAIVTILGVLAYQLVREPAVKRVPAQTGLRKQLTIAKGIWRKDAQYRRYVVARIALLLAIGVSPLVFGYAQDQFDLSPNTVSVLVIADTISRLITVALSGWLSARFGDRLLVRMAMIFGLAALVLLLLAGSFDLGPQLVLPYFVLIFVLLAAYGGALTIGLFAINLNIAPPEQFPLYVGLSNTLLGIALYISSAQGVLVGLLGYWGVFLLAGLLIMFGWWLFTRIHDPRESDG